MPLVGALLCKNEGGRDLGRVLDRLSLSCDELVVLDDGSTDDSVAIARQHGATVRVREQQGMWGNEAPARAELWNWGVSTCKDGWLLIADCDMLLEGDPRPYTRSEQCNTWNWVLYDLWDSETTFRCDGFWQAHTVPRPWLFRPRAVPLGWYPVWPDRGLHTGHLPKNWPAIPGIAHDLAWGHLAYLTPDRRLAKHHQYLSRRDQLTSFEIAHAESILG